MKQSVRKLKYKVSLFVSLVVTVSMVTFGLDLVLTQVRDSNSLMKQSAVQYLRNLSSLHNKVWKNP